MDVKTDRRLIAGKAFASLALSSTPDISGSSAQS
jgi:hypothetical protein